MRSSSSRRTESWLHVPPNRGVGPWKRRSAGEVAPIEGDAPRVSVGVVCKLVRAKERGGHFNSTFG